MGDRLVVDVVCIEHLMQSGERHVRALRSESVTRRAYAAPASATTAYPRDGSAPIDVESRSAKQPDLLT
jgi:hypothetical protein